jgi:hypothetical protein
VPDSNESSTLAAFEEAYDDIDRRVDLLASCAIPDRSSEEAMA